MTAFEPEAGSQIIVGLDFHKFYFDNRKSTTMSCTITHAVYDHTPIVPATKPFQESILHPKVHLLGDGVACIAYTRLSQRQDRYPCRYCKIISLQ